MVHRVIPVRCDARIFDLCESRGIRLSQHLYRRAATAACPRALHSQGLSDMIIAIDGPAASGKGTLGKRLAHHYGYRHLDTGVIYRAVAYALMQSGHDLRDEAAAVAAAMELDPEKFGNPA